MAREVLNMLGNIWLYRVILGLHWGDIREMEKQMETTIVYWHNIGVRPPCSGPRIVMQAL